MYKCWNGRAKQFMKVSRSFRANYNEQKKRKRKRNGERTAFWKTLVKVRVSPCGHFPGGNHCFPTRLPNQDIFYDSRFNPAVILSKASQHSQRHQPDEFLSCDARELTETLLNRLTCLKSHCAAHVLEKLITLCQEESLPEVGLHAILVKKKIRSTLAETDMKSH